MDPYERPDANNANAALSNLVLLGGSAHPALSAAVARELGVTVGGCRIERFPDGETHVEVESRDVVGRDVYILQPTSKPASDHLLELLFLADACHRAGASSVSAVVPYFGYARQDRRKRPGEALGVRVVAQLFATARLARIVSVDLHSDVVEASLSTPLEHLSAVPLLAEALLSNEGLSSNSRGVVRDAVVVAPDLGAVRIAREYARLLKLPLAVVHKVRQSATDVLAECVVGDVRGLRPILVDDMIATGGTLVAAARSLYERGSKNEIVVAATHGVFAPRAVERLHDVGLRHLFITDTIAMPPFSSSSSSSDSSEHVVPPHASTTIVSIAPLLAASLNRGRKRSAA